MPVWVFCLQRENGRETANQLTPLRGEPGLAVSLQLQFLIFRVPGTDAMLVNAVQSFDLTETWGGRRVPVLVHFKSRVALRREGKGEERGAGGGKACREKARGALLLPGPLQVWSARVPCARPGGLGEGEARPVPAAPAASLAASNRSMGPWGSFLEAIPGPFSCCSAFWSDRNLPYAGYCMPAVLPSAVRYGKQRVSARFPRSGHQVTQRLPHLGNSVGR